MLGYPSKIDDIHSVFIRCIDRAHFHTDNVLRK
jgi:hypothetical protein